MARNSLSNTSKLLLPGQGLFSTVRTIPDLVGGCVCGGGGGGEGESLILANNMAALFNLVKEHCL